MVIDLLGTPCKLFRQHKVGLFHRWKLKLHAQIDNPNENIWSAESNFRSSDFSLVITKKMVSFFTYTLTRQNFFIFID